MDGMTCPECGQGEIRRASLGGRRMRFRQIPDLELPVSVEGPVCSHCGELWMDAETTKAVAAALETEWSAAVREKARDAIDRLNKRVPQRELESLLGMSPGWLSKIKGGRETSATTAAALILLANEPSRVEELRASWADRFQVVQPVAPIVSLEEVRLRSRTTSTAPSMASELPETTVSARGNASPTTEMWQGGLVA